MAPHGAALCAQHSVQDLQHSKSKCVNSIFNPNLVPTRAQQPSLGSDTIPKRAVTASACRELRDYVQISVSSTHADITGNFTKCLDQEQKTVQSGACEGSSDNAPSDTNPKQSRMEQVDAENEYPSGDQGVQGPRGRAVLDTTAGGQCVRGGDQDGPRGSQPRAVAGSKFFSLFRRNQG